MVKATADQAAFDTFGDKTILVRGKSLKPVNDFKKKE